MTVDQYKALATRSYADGGSGGTIEFASDVSSADASAVTFASGITYVLSSGDNTVSLGDSGITLKTQGSGTNAITLGGESGVDTLTLASSGKQTVIGSLTSGDKITATTAATLTDGAATKSFAVAAGGSVSAAASEESIALTLGNGGSSSAPLYNGDLSTLGTIASVTISGDATTSTYMTLTADYAGEISASGGLYVTASGSSGVDLGTIVTTGSDVDAPYSGSSGGLKGATVDFTASANGDSVVIDVSSSASVSGGSGADTFMFKSSVASGAKATFDVDLGSDGKSDHVYLSWGETLSGGVVVNLEDMEFGSGGDTTNVLSTALESLTKENALKVLQDAFSGDLSSTKVADVTAYALGLGTEVTDGAAKLFSIDDDVYAVLGVMDGNVLSDASGNSDASFGDGEIVIKLTGAAKDVDSTTLVNNVRSALIGTDLNALGNAPGAAIEVSGTEDDETSILKFSATSGAVTVTMSESGAVSKVKIGDDELSSVADINGDALEDTTITGVDFSNVTGAATIGTVNEGSNSGSGGLLGANIELTAGSGGVTAYVNATESAKLTGSSAADTFMLVSDAAAGSTSSFIVDLGSGSAADSAADKVMIDYSFEMSGSATIEIKNIGSGDTTNVAKATVESLTVAKALGVINGAFTSLNATSGDVTAYSWDAKVTDATTDANLFVIGGNTYAIVGDATNETNFNNSTFDNGEIVVKLTGIAAETGDNADSTFISSILTFMNESVDQG